MNRHNQLCVMYGAIRAARSVLEHAMTVHPRPFGYDERLDAIDEELRKLARDIAKECGL